MRGPPLAHKVGVRDRVGRMCVSVCVSEGPLTASAALSGVVGVCACVPPPRALLPSLLSSPPVRVVFLYLLFFGASTTRLSRSREAIWSMWPLLTLARCI